MLGWEFPPHISGGLGTACEGLATALAAQGVALTFLVPHLAGDEDAPYMTLLAPPAHGAPPVTPAPPPPAPPVAPTPTRTPSSPPHASEAKAPGPAATHAPPPSAPAPKPVPITPASPAPTRASDLHERVERALERVTVLGVSSSLSPYLTPTSYLERMLARRRRAAGARGGSAGGASVDGEDPGELEAPSGVAGGNTTLAELARVLELDVRDLEHEHEPEAHGGSGGGGHYGGDLFEEVTRYARRCARLAASLEFDVIHAHDWMTFPAALLIGQLSGRPVVLHVHSLEFDRSGAHPHPRIDAIERAGVHAADRVIAVSHYTKAVIARQHGVPVEKIEVVHNGIAHKQRLRTFHQAHATRAEKTVLFLGRVTFQKGPDYFVEAAAHVIPRYPNVRFVVAGTGDMLPRLVERVAALGLSRYFHFTGFVRGQQLELMFSIADVYVMPSVSEPFGIAPLEALVRDTPVIISKQSGVSEVLRHALRVDFWDTRRLAELILAVLSYPAIGKTMTALGVEELLTLRWESSAARVRAIYDDVLRT